MYSQTLRYEITSVGRCRNEWRLQWLTKVSLTSSICFDFYKALATDNSPLETGNSVFFKGVVVKGTGNVLL
jgi:hypothetical protein